MPASQEPVPTMASVSTTGEPMSTGKSRRVRFILPSGRVVCPRRAELAARDTVILATGAKVASKRAAHSDAGAGAGLSSGPVAKARLVYRGAVPLKRFKRCHHIDEATGGGSTGNGPAQWSREDQDDVKDRLVSSAGICGTSQPSNAYDGFMVQVMTMYDDESNLHKKMKTLTLECGNFNVVECQPPK